MRDLLRIDSVGLEAIATNLRTATTTVESIETWPNKPNGGELSDNMFGLLDKLINDVAGLVAWLHGESELLDRALAEYAVQDQASADQVGNLGIGPHVPGTESWRN